MQSLVWERGRSGACAEGVVSAMRLCAIRPGKAGPERYRRGQLCEFQLTVVDDLGDPVVDLCLDEICVSFSCTSQSQEPAAHAVTLVGPGTATVCYVVKAASRVTVDVRAGACTARTTARALGDAGELQLQRNTLRLLLARPP